jgi:enamine deaminase RidA (YjgF/YER057c/UK114 family)
MAARSTSAKGSGASIQRIKPGVRFSTAVIHGDLVHVAGQVASDTKGGITGQTKSVLKALDAALKAAGTNKSKLLSCTVYLADMRNFAAYNAVWDAWVDKANMPTRATVEARLATPDYLIEIVAVAAR